MAALANGAQTLTAGFWFLAQVIPKATGYSFFMLPSDNYATYQIPIYDNPIIYDLITYNKNTDMKTKNSLKTKKFDFAMNQYKASRAEFQGDQMYVVAQGNNESMVLFKTVDGIIGFNWASTEYKGNRKNVGSMSNGLSDCIGFVNELIEREMIGGEKF